MAGYLGKGIRHSPASVSILDRLTATGGRATGFDYLRVILALSVIVWHSFPLSYGAAIEVAGASKIFLPLVNAILPMFFALSGFLVAGSLERNASLITFAGLRIIRIIPALAVEVFLSALVLGPLLTTATLSAYFSDAKFYAYFLNILGDIHFTLPGLFASNPFPHIVNGQLWTVPWELKCYVALTGLALFGVTRRRKAFLAITLLACPALWALDLYTGAPSPGVSLFVGFFAGVAIFKFRDAISWDWRLASASAALMLLLLFFPKGDYAAGFPAAYLTVYLGLTNPKKIAPFRNADYSYGLYLYGYAIQQAVARIFPWSHHWYINLAISVPLAAAFAALSWTLVEKPSLRLRSWLPLLEDLGKRPMETAEAKSPVSPSA